MRDIKTILIILAAALWPAAAAAQVPGPVTDTLLANGSTAFMMNTDLWQTDEWSLENNIARSTVTGELYVTGTFWNASTNSTKIFVRKISPAGAAVWTSTITNSVTSTANDYGRGVALSPDGSAVYALGVMQLATQDIIVAKYDAATGAELWAGTYAAYDSGDHSDNAYDIVADETYAYVAGTKQEDIAIFRFPASGGAPDVTPFDGGDSHNAAYAIALRGGMLALAGVIDAGNWNKEIWVARYSTGALLTHVWASTNTSTMGSDEAHAVKIDPNNNIYAAGSLFSYDSGQDIWLGKYDRNGNLLGSAVKNGPRNGEDLGFGLALDGLGNVYVSGRTQAFDYTRDLWVGKYSTSLDLVSEVSAHRSEDAGYDVEVSSWTVYVGGAFGSDYGVLQVYPEQFGTPPDLFAGPGWFAGAVNLNWVFPEAGSYDYRIQTALSQAAAWDPAAAGNIAVDGVNVSANEQRQHEVFGLPVRMDHTAAMPSPGPVYYFRVWTSPAGLNTWTPRDTIASAVPFTPYNYWDTMPNDPQARDRYWVFQSAYGAGSAAAARDGEGNTYIAYPSNMGGLALVKFGPYGDPKWASFYNDPEGNSRYTVRRLEVGPAGGLYAAGSAVPDSSGVSEAWLGKFDLLGLRQWDALLGDGASPAAFNALATDGSGNVYAGGYDGAGNAMLLAKYDPGTGALLSSTTYRGGDAGAPDVVWALARDASDNIYAGGQFNLLNGSAVDGDAALVRFNTALQVQGSPMRYVNAPLSADIASGDAIYDLAVSGAQLYAAGAKFTHTASDDYSNFWLATMGTSDLAEDWSAAFNNSPTYLPAAARGVALSDGYLYVAGYETRLSQEMVEHKNIVLRKYDVEDLGSGALWNRVIDGISPGDSALGLGLRAGSDGVSYVPALFGAYTDMGGDRGAPGLARLSEPQSGLLAEPGYKPCSVRLEWIADSDLPPGATFYVHYATHSSFVFDAASARYSFIHEYPAFTGNPVNITVPGLEAGNGAQGIDSPLHYFKLGYEVAGTTTPVAESTAAVANTPGVWDRMSNYSNGRFFLINGAHGGSNPLVRDQAGNIYTAGYFNPWGSFYAAYVRKFTPAGQPIWTRFYADQYEYSRPVINALFLDGQGNLYAAGSAGSDSWGYDGPESDTGVDALLIKYSAADGRMHWARTYDLEGAGRNDAFYALAAGPSALYVAGKRYNDSGSRGEDAVAYGFGFDGVPSGDKYLSTQDGDDVFYALDYDTVNNRLYAGGKAYNGSDYDGVVKVLNVSLGLSDSLTVDEGTEDAVYAVKVDTANSAYYVAGAMGDAGAQDAFLRKYPLGSTAEVWISTYNSANQNGDEARGLALDGLGGVYISGSEARYDMNQGRNVFMRKYNTGGDLIWTQTLNSASVNEDRAGGIAVDPAGGVYAAVDAGDLLPQGTAPLYDSLNGAGYFRHIQFNMSVTNPRLTVRVNRAANQGLGGVGVAVMGFSQTGGIDPNGINLGLTDPTTGAITFSLPGGKSYFIAVSSHNMVPTIKDQLSDPNGNFFVELNADVTKQYFISPRQAAADPVHVMSVTFSTHTDTLAAGDYVMGEVFINQTGERVGYSVVTATAVHNTMEIHNLPAADNGVYGMAVSVPARNKVLQLFMNGAFPLVASYAADMTAASQLTGSFEVGVSTVPPSIMGMVMTEQWAPIEGARVRLELSSCTVSGWETDDPMAPGYNNCTDWEQPYGRETFSDAGGSFAFYDVPHTSAFDPAACAVPHNCTQREVIGTSYNLNVGKAGYASGYSGFGFPAGTPTPYMGSGGPGDSTMFNLAVATYTLSGILRYNGVPLPNATIMVFPDWNWYDQGADSYRQCEQGGCGIRSDARALTAADGSFTVTGLTDGNARIEAAFEGGWRSLNEGNDYETRSDDRRVTISSQSAVPPSPMGDCRPGRVWVTDSSGTCKTGGSVVFNILPQGGNSLGRLWGNVTFVTTYTVSASNPLVISTAAPLTIMAQQRCDGGNCGNQQMGFTSLAGTFLSNTTGYSITLSSGVTYYPRIFSSAWAKASSFESEINLSSTDTFRHDMSVVRAGALRGVMKLPDGTNFKPSCSSGGCAYAAEIEIEGINVDVGDGRRVDEYGEFEFPNLAPGNYRVAVRPEGNAFVWAPAVLDNVAVSEGKTAEVRLQLEQGLAVKPAILGLPVITTPTWHYTVISVPSGTEMNQKKITELFFSKTQYGFDYSTSTGWSTMYMAPGQYDFYLLLGSRYDPGGGDGGEPSFRQFANFIGRVKSVAIQKDPNNPALGTAAQPVPINILGSVGQAGLSGTVVGGSLFTDADYDRIFGNFEQLFDLIPAVMLYDSAGDLKGFSHAMPGSPAVFDAFEGAIVAQDKTAMRAVLDSDPMTYGVWGLPPGRYTAVFNNPNYPPVAKEILDLASPGADVTAFDFDNEEVVTAGISGVVRSSVTLEPLAGARVYLQHRTVEKFTLTDSSGAFTFSNLPTGIYRLEVMRNGYVTAGKKTGLSADENESFALYMLPSESRISGRIYMSKFPTQVTKAGVTVVAYDETANVNDPSAYLPKTEVQTDASGNFEIPGVVPGHIYKLSAFYAGKMPAVLEVAAQEGDTVTGDITLKDIPPQISIKVRKSPDSANKVDVTIRSPKTLINTPSCVYSPGEELDEAAAVTLALVPGPNRTYLGQFTVSSSRRYYTVKVTAGDAGNKMEKSFVYDQVSNAKTEQYIQQESLAGGSVQMDKETEEYSGIELDPGALSYSTATSDTVDYANLVGGFFSSLPSVRTVKTDKGELSISDAIQSLMASEVYNMDLSNATANKPFTLTLKYDKERGAAHTRTMRIYQQDADGSWNEVPGDYTVDPMLGVLSVDVGSLTDAVQGAAVASTPLGRKSLGMSAVVNGRYVPAASPPVQQGRFAVMTAPPTQGAAAYSGAFEIFNLPNPFDLKSKNVTLDAADLAGASVSNPYPTGGTVLKFNLPAGKGGNVKFVIYNLAGEKVRTLDMGNLAGGKLYYSEWDGRNDKNRECASGVYFLLPFVNGEKLTGKAHKMAIIK